MSAVMLALWRWMLRMDCTAQTIPFQVPSQGSPFLSQPDQHDALVSPRDDSLNRKRASTDLGMKFIRRRPATPRLGRVHFLRCQLGLLSSRIDYRSETHQQTRTPQKANPGSSAAARGAHAAPSHASAALVTHAAPCAAETPS
jgi:hypothetical protein